MKTLLDNGILAASQERSNYQITPKGLHILHRYQQLFEMIAEDKQK
jgi:predicted transcriptional regulator